MAATHGGDDYDGGDDSKSVEVKREKNSVHHLQLQLIQQHKPCRHAQL